MASLAAIAALLWVSSARAEVQPGLPKPSKPLDLSTPHATMRLFLDAGSARDYTRAAHSLDLRGVASQDRARRGAELARKLHTVIARKLWIDFDKLPAKASELSKIEGQEIVVGRIPLDAGHVPIAVRRTSLGGSPKWLISPATVAQIGALYDAHGPTWIERQLPSWLTEVALWDVALWQWLGIPLVLLLTLGLAFSLTALALGAGWRIASRTNAQWDDLLVDMVRGPLRVFLTVVIFWGTILALQLPAGAQRIVNKSLQIGLTLSVSWLILRLVNLAATTIERQAIDIASSEGDDLKVRGIKTQARVMERVATIGVAIIAVALILLQFEPVRSVGMSLLASAGVLGIIFGLAAQRTISTMLAGIQVSITQPIRIGDTVIFDGYWGTIEEVTLTYVVVRVWDDRRLVVPVSKFLDEPFENWTKVSPELFGVVYLYVDYRIPVDEIREALKKILADHPSWDERASSVLVTDTLERTMEVRALMSATNANELWALRCHVREELVAWLHRFEEGRYLPRARVELERDETISARA